MRNLFSVFLVFLAICMVHAGAPTLATIGNMDAEIVTSSTDTTTVTGTTPDTFLVKQNLVHGWSYVLTAYDSIGAAADSAHFGLIMYGTDRLTPMYVGNFGSALTGTTADSYLLPIGVTAFGGCFSLTFTRTNATNVSKVYRWELWKVRNNSIEQSWNINR